MPLLLASDDTVPFAIWLGKGMHSIERFLRVALRRTVRTVEPATCISSPTLYYYTMTPPKDINCYYL